MRSDLQKRREILTQIGLSKTDVSKVIRALTSSSDDLTTILPALAGLSGRSRQLISSYFGPQSLTTGANSNVIAATNMTADTNTSTNTNVNSYSNLNGSNTSHQFATKEKVHTVNEIPAALHYKLSTKSNYYFHRCQSQTFLINFVVTEWTVEDVALVMEHNFDASDAEIIRQNRICGNTLVFWFRTGLTLADLAKVYTEIPPPLLNRVLEFTNQKLAQGTLSA